MNISGNVIPMAWYRTIVNANGKPNLAAINILADVVYWYRPTEIRDEKTGQVVGIRCKFREDLLQRSYADLSDMFGLSRKQIKDALLCLESYGVVKRIFRKKFYNGQCLNNVMYLALDPQSLYMLTYPEKSKDTLQDCQEESKDMLQDCQEECTETETDPVLTRLQVCPSGDTPLFTEEEAYTENNAEIFKEITAERTEKTPNPSIRQKDEHPAEMSTNRKTDAMDDVRICRSMIRRKIDYDILMQDKEFQYDHETIDELVELIVDTIVIPRETVRIGGTDYPQELVKQKFLRLTAEHIRYVLSSLKSSTAKVHNIRSYLLTSLYNAADTISNFYQAEVNHDLHSTGMDFY